MGTSSDHSLPSVVEPTTGGARLFSWVADSD